MHSLISYGYQHPMASVVDLRAAIELESIFKYECLWRFPDAVSRSSVSGRCAQPIRGAAVPWMGGEPRPRYWAAPAAMAQQTAPGQRRPSIWVLATGPAARAVPAWRLRRIPLFPRVPRNLTRTPKVEPAGCKGRIRRMSWCLMKAASLAHQRSSSRSADGGSARLVREARGGASGSHGRRPDRCCLRHSAPPARRTTTSAWPSPSVRALYVTITSTNETQRTVTCSLTLTQGATPSSTQAAW